MPGHSRCSKLPLTPHHTGPTYSALMHPESKPFEPATHSQPLYTSLLRARPLSNRHKSTPGTQRHSPPADIPLCGKALRKSQPGLPSHPLPPSPFAGTRHSPHLTQQPLPFFPISRLLRGREFGNYLSAPSIQ